MSSSTDFDLGSTATPRHGPGMGVASLVLGAAALSLCLIPFLNLLSIVLASVGLLVGMFALLRGVFLGYAFAGMFTCALALVVSLQVNAWLGGEAKHAMDEAQQWQEEVVLE